MQTAGHIDPTSGPFGDVAAASIAHLNGDHDDTVAFLASVLCDASPDHLAELVMIDHDGLTFCESAHTDRLRSDRLHHVKFANRAETPDDAYREFLGLLVVARQRAGENDLTSLEREFSEVTRVATFVTRVSDVRAIHDRLLQVTVEGGLERFSPLGPDQFVYVLAPPHGRDELTVDESFTWESFEKLAEDERPVGAYYTVRRWHPERAAIDLWVVLHGHGGDGETWARTALAGAPVALWGPRSAYERPASTDAVVLLGDETALPAIAAIVEQLDSSDRATVIVTLDDAAEPLALDSGAPVDVRWVTVAHDDRTNRLLMALTDLPVGTITPSTYVWGGAESHDVTEVRRYVRDVIGLPRQQVSLTGYWRR